MKWSDDQVRVYLMLRKGPAVLPVAASFLPPPPPPPPPIDIVEDPAWWTELAAKRRSA